MIKIRNAILGDIPYLYDICARTALDGEDSRGSMSDDNKVGHYFAAPYLHFDLASCFILTINDIAVGYLLGTTDTSNYTQWLNNEWLKQIRPLYSRGSNAESEFDAFLNTVINSNAENDPRLDGFDAHFHIDILKPYQNIGWGKKLIEAFMGHCKQQKVNKLYLMVSSSHLKALSFYKHVGFRELFKVEGAIAIGIDIK